MVLVWKEWSSVAKSVNWWIMLEKLLLKGGLSFMTQPILDDDLGEIDIQVKIFNCPKDQS